MQKDKRDLLEVLIFDEIEETVGTRLRMIIQRLEKEQTATRRDRKQRTPGGEKLTRTLLNQMHDPKSAKPTCPDALKAATRWLPKPAHSPTLRVQEPGRH